MDWMWVKVTLVLYLQALARASLDWETIRCAIDIEEPIPEGTLPPEQIGRFPWLGVVQHSFYLGGKTRYAITGAVLIHPAYVIAPAEDVAKIERESIFNTTYVIFWRSATVKYTFNVLDYILNPEFEEELTFASFALVEILTDGQTLPAHPAPILPICMPFKGSGTFDDLYAVKMTDVTGELQKEAFKVDFIENNDCNIFYEKAELGYKKMAPRYQLCAVVHAPAEPCVWDGGVALITRRVSFWTLMGFGVRGPGCGAPARFVDFNQQMAWVDERISRIPLSELPDGTVAFTLRQWSPIELVMYKNSEAPGGEQGQCERRERGSIMFKEQDELIVNKNFVQGFYYVSVAYIADYTCAIIKLEGQARTNLAIWIEHHCHRDYSGMIRPPDLRRLECFLFFRTTAYMEFRFYFSFKCQLEITLFGKYVPRRVGGQYPWVDSETTLPWYPTDPSLLRWAYFVPSNAWWYYM